MRLQTRGELFLGRSAENVETQVVAHDSRQQLRLDSSSVGGVARSDIIAWLDRRPGRNPQWADPARLVQDFGDVSSPFKHRDAQVAVLNRRRTPPAEEQGIRHRRVLCRGSGLSVFVSVLPWAVLQRATCSNGVMRFKESLDSARTVRL